LSEDYSKVSVIITSFLAAGCSSLNVTSSWHDWVIQMKYCPLEQTKIWNQSIILPLSTIFLPCYIIFVGLSQVMSYYMLLYVHLFCCGSCGAAIARMWTASFQGPWGFIQGLPKTNLADNKMLTKF
jgi:hypothetical protein